MPVECRLDHRTDVAGTRKEEEEKKIIAQVLLLGMVLTE